MSMVDGSTGRGSGGAPWARRARRPGPVRASAACRGERGKTRVRATRRSSERERARPRLLGLARDALTAFPAEPPPSLAPPRPREIARAGAGAPAHATGGGAGRAGQPSRRGGPRAGGASAAAQGVGTEADARRWIPHRGSRLPDVPARRSRTRAPRPRAPRGPRSGLVLGHGPAAPDARVRCARPIGVPARTRPRPRGLEGIEPL